MSQAAPKGPHQHNSECPFAESNQYLINPGTQRWLKGENGHSKGHVEATITHESPDAWDVGLRHWESKCKGTSMGKEPGGVKGPIS